MWKEKNILIFSEGCKVLCTGLKKYTHPNCSDILGKSNPESRDPVGLTIFQDLPKVALWLIWRNYLTEILE